MVAAAVAVAVAVAVGAVDVVVVMCVCCGCGLRGVRREQMRHARRPLVPIIKVRPARVVSRRERRGVAVINQQRRRRLCGFGEGIADRDGADTRATLLRVRERRLPR